MAWRVRSKVSSRDIVQDSEASERRVDQSRATLEFIALPPFAEIAGIRLINEWELNSSPP